LSSTDPKAPAAVPLAAQMKMIRSIWAAASMAILSLRLTPHLIPLREPTPLSSLWILRALTNFAISNSILESRYAALEQPPSKFAFKAQRLSTVRLILVVTTVRFRQWPKQPAERPVAVAKQAALRAIRLAPQLALRV